VAGILFGLAYSVVRSWLPSHGAPRGLVYGAVLAAALGTPTLVDGDNLDFALLDGDALAVAMLLACAVLHGAGSAASSTGSRRGSRPCFAGAPPA
jgi:hypothetical protein